MAKMKYQIFECSSSWEYRLQKKLNDGWEIYETILGSFWSGSTKLILRKSSG